METLTNTPSSDSSGDQLCLNVGPDELVRNGIVFRKTARRAHSTDGASDVWMYGDRYRSGSSRFDIYRCRLCLAETRIRHGSGESAKSAAFHLKVKHDISLSSGTVWVESIEDDVLEHHQRLAATVNIDRLRDLVVQWVVNQRIPLESVESREFIEVLTCLSPDVVGMLGDRTMFSHRLWDEFQRSKFILGRTLATSLSKIHISFDVWSSPQQLPIVMVVAHWLAQAGPGVRRRSALIGAKAIEANYTGDDIASAIMPIIETFGIWDRLGVFVAKHTGSGDRAIDRIVREFSPKTSDIDVIDVSSRRVCCMADIVNLAAKAYLFGNDGQPSPAAYPLNADDLELAEKRKAWWRKKGLIGKLVNVITYIAISPARTNRFDAYMAIRDEDGNHFRPNVQPRTIPSPLSTSADFTPNTSVVFNDVTGRNPTLQSIEGALCLQEPISMYCLDLRAELGEDYITWAEWDQLEGIHKGLRPFIEVLKLLQGDFGDIYYASIWKSLPLLEVLLQHTKRGLSEELAGKEKSPMATAYQNAQVVLEKYHTKLESSHGTYAAATLLNPSLRLRYFERQWWQHRSDLKHKMLETVRTKWESDYKALKVEEPAPPVPKSFMQEIIDEQMGVDAAAAAAAAVANVETHFDQYVKGQSTYFMKQQDDDLLEWWNFCQLPQLRQMAFDILSIPATAPLIERYFDDDARIPLLVPEEQDIGVKTLEQAELLRSW